MSRLEEEISSLYYKVGYFYFKKGDNSIMIKEPFKGSVVVVWDREDYLKEAKKQLDDENVYKELTGDVERRLEKVIKGVLKKVRDRRDISNSTIGYFLVNNSKLGWFYLLPKINKRLQNAPGLPVLSNSGYYLEKKSAFLEFHLRSLARKVKCYMKDTNDFLRKVASLPASPDVTFLCTIDILDLHRKYVA